MGVKLTVKNFGPGRIATVNGKKIGAFQFIRNPQNYSEHVLEYPTAAAFNAVADELLATKGNPQMYVRVIPEAAAEDTALKDQISVLQKSAEGHAATVEGLQQQIAKLTHDAETAKGNSTGLTSAQSAMLAERDAFMEAMHQYATESETPIQCLTRLLAAVTPGSPPANLPPGTPAHLVPVVPPIDPLSLGYDAMLKFAKGELGIVYKAKPSKAQLTEDVKVKLTAIA